MFWWCPNSCFIYLLVDFFYLALLVVRNWSRPVSPQTEKNILKARGVGSEPWNIHPKPPACALCSHRSCWCIAMFHNAMNTGDGEASQGQQHDGARQCCRSVHWGMSSMSPAMCSLLVGLTCGCVIWPLANVDHISTFYLQSFSCFLQ